MRQIILVESEEKVLPSIERFGTEGWKIKTIIPLNMCRPAREGEPQDRNGLYWEIRLYVTMIKPK